MNLTRLESTVLSLKRLYPLSLLEVSKSQKVLGHKKKFGLMKIFGHKEILGPQIFFGPKQLWVKKYLILKKFWAQTNFRIKKSKLRKNFVTKKV